jgi:hypothetical protein
MVTAHLDLASPFSSAVPEVNIGFRDRSEFH